MAYNRNTASNNNNTDSYEKAKAFINLSIPRINNDGSMGRAKLVGIPLRESDENHKILLEWLQKDEGNINKLLTKMKADFQLVNPAGRGVLCLDD